MDSLPSRRLLAASVPVAAVLAFWNVLAALSPFPAVDEGLRNAGVVMAALYVFVLGVSLGREADSRPTVTEWMVSRSSDAAGGEEQSAVVVVVLRENAEVVLTAGVWFVAAVLLRVVESILPLPSSDGLVALVFAGAGVGTVGLYAVATATAFWRGPTAAPAPADV